MKVYGRLKIAAAMLMSLVLTTGARAQVLNQVPSNALVVVKIKSLNDLNQKAAFFAQDWGLATAREELKDPLGTMLKMGGMGPGIDMNGDAALAIMKPAQGGAEPDMVGLVPVKDFKAFAATLPNARVENNLVTFKPGPDGLTLYATPRGKYAAISQKQELVTGQGALGLTLPATTLKELDTKDVSAVLNIKSVRQDVLPQFQNARDIGVKQLEQAMQQAPNASPKLAPVIKAYITQIFNVAEGFMKEADAVTLGLALSKDGIGTSMLVEFDPNSYMGKAVQKMKNTDASFTKGLPQGAYMLYGGMVVDPTAVQLLNDFLAPIEKEAAAAGDEGKPITAYLKLMRESMSSVRQSNFGILVPNLQAALRRQGAIQAVTVNVGDAEKMMAAQKQMISAMQDMAKGVGAAMPMTITSTPNAKTVAGVAFDKITVTFNMDAGDPQMAQVNMMLKMMFGAGGLTTYTGAVDKQHVISITGENDSLIENAIATLKANSDPLAKGPAAEVDKGLPKSRLAAFYLPADQIAKTVLDFMAARGVAPGVKVAENLPPLAGTMSVDGTAVRMDGYFPEKTVQSLISTGMEMYLMQMPGAKAPGAPNQP